MKITSKGQVTIPLDIREKLGLFPDTEVEFVVDGNAAKIIKLKTKGKSRGDRIVSALKGQLKDSMSTEQIMKLTRD